MPDRHRLPNLRSFPQTRIATILTGLLFGLLTILALPVHAQGAPACAERGQILAFLDRNFEEKPTAVGVTADGQLLEVLSNPSGSWTLVLTEPGGISCMIFSGQGWRQKRLQSKDPLA